MEQGKQVYFDEVQGGSCKVTDRLTLGEFGKFRVDEILMLSEVISEPTAKGQLFQKLPKHMRRRQMSHNNNRLPRRLQSFVDDKVSIYIFWQTVWQAPGLSNIDHRQKCHPSAMGRQAGITAGNAVQVDWHLNKYAGFKGATLTLLGTEGNWYVFGIKFKWERHFLGQTMLRMSATSCQSYKFVPDCIYF